MCVSEQMNLTLLAYCSMYYSQSLPSDITTYHIISWFWGNTCKGVLKPVAENCLSEERWVPPIQHHQTMGKCVPGTTQGL